jgi:thiol:disulfide interchange protein
MTDVPAYVTRAAEQHGLGALVVGRKGSNPVTWFIGFGGLAVGGGALLYAAMWWLPRVLDKGNAGLAAALAVAGIGVVFAAGIGVRWLVKGFTAHYVYEQGAIQTRNRRVSVARWEQLDELQRAVTVRAGPVP